MSAAQPTRIETPLGRARWILSTDERGTQAEVEAFDDVIDRLAMLSHRANWIHPDDYAELKQALQRIAAIPLQSTGYNGQAHHIAREALNHIEIGA